MNPPFEATVLDSGELVAITQPRWRARVVPVRQVVDIRELPRAVEVVGAPARCYDRTGRLESTSAALGLFISALA